MSESGTPEQAKGRAESALDIFGWSIGGIVGLTSYAVIVTGGHAPYYPSLLLGVSILPPVVDLVRRFVPVWRFPFVPTAVFIVGMLWAWIWLPEATRPEYREQTFVDWHRTVFGWPLSLEPIAGLEVPPVIAGESDLKSNDSEQ